MTRWLAAVSALAGPMLALGGEVWSTDGRVVEGIVRIGNRGEFSVLLPGGSTTALKAEEVAYAWFGSQKGPTALSLPSPLKGYSIGSGKPGAIAFSEGEHTLRATLENGGGSLDNCAFFGREINGSTELGLSIPEGSLTNGSIGLTVRESLDPGARYVTLLVGSEGDVTVRYRQEPGGPVIDAPAEKEKPGKAKTPAEAKPPKPKFPLQVRMVRRGRNCTWYKRTEEQSSWGPSGQLFADWQYDHWLGGNRKTPEPGVGMGGVQYGGVVLVPASAGEAKAVARDVRLRDGLADPNTEVPGGLGDSYLSIRVQDTAKGLLLRDGSFLGGASITAIGENEAQFDDLAGGHGTLPSSRLARANLTALPPGLSSNIPADGNGVLLASGEFMDGQLKSWSGGKVTVSSVVFGLSSFQSPGEAKAIAWHSPSENGVRWMLAMRDGSWLAANSLRSEQGEVVVEEPVLGVRRILAREIYAIRPGGDHAIPLATLRPQKINMRYQGREVISASCFDPVWGNWLTANGRGAAFGVAAPMGAEVVYEIPAGARRFVGWLSVAERVGGADTDLRIVALVDKSKAMETTLRRTKGIHGIAPVNISVSGGKTLLLKIDGEGKGAQGYGIWGDGMFLKD